MNPQTPGTDPIVLSDAGPTQMRTTPDPTRLPLWTSPELKGLWIYLIVLGVAFGKPLFDLVRFSLNSGLYSYVLLMPVVFVYLARIQLRELTPPVATQPVDQNQSICWS
jgi:hypothetical protein